MDAGRLGHFAVGLAAVALVACLIRAWRTLDIDPARMLRQE
jgi:ABC-type lipoprotein release transport system permease subunit